MTRPSHLGAQYAAQFQDRSMVRAYRHRPPYPTAAVERLAALVPQSCPTVLDVGCGTGDLAIPLAGRVARVDAVDVSEAMLAAARSRPQPEGRLHWILGAAERAPLSPPYGLCTAGESLHWMDWGAVLGRVRAALHPDGRIAIVGRTEAASPWTAALLDLIRAYSTNRAFRPYNLLALLEQDCLFAAEAVLEVEAVEVRQSVADYVESVHSRNGFSRDRMDPARAAEFDARATALLEPYADGDRRLGLRVGARIAVAR